MADYGFGGMGNTGGLGLGGGGDSGSNNSSMGGGQGLGGGGNTGGLGLGGGSGGGYGGGNSSSNFGYGLTDGSDPGIGSMGEGSNPGFGDNTFNGPSGDFSGGNYGFSSLGSSTGFSLPSASWSSFAAPAAPAWNGSFNLTSNDLNSSVSPTTSVKGEEDDKKDWNRRLMSLLGYAVPQARPVMSLLSGLQSLSDGDTGRAAGIGAGLATNNGLIGNLANAGVNLAQGKPVQSGFAENTGRTLGGMFGGIAGPLGALAGSEFGGWMGRGIANGETTPAGPSYGSGERGAGNPNGAVNPLFFPKDGITYGGTGQPTNQNMAGYLGGGGANGASQNYMANSIPTKNSDVNWGNVVSGGLGGLMSLYGLNQQRNASKDQQAQLAALMEAQQTGMQQLQQEQPQIAAPAVHAPNFGGISSKLDGMFSADSAAGRQLRQTLDRKDAAAGRRSQYGPREVALLSELTRLRAQAEPAYMNAEVARANAANQGAYNMYNAQLTDARNRYNTNLQSFQNGQTLNLNALNQNNQIQQNRNTQNQQYLASLYGIGKETGLFNYVGDSIGSWWNS